VSPIVDNQPIATQTIPGTKGAPGAPPGGWSAQTFQQAHRPSVDFALAHAPFLSVLTNPNNAPAVAALSADKSAANLARVEKLIGAKNTTLLIKYQVQLSNLVQPYQTELKYLQTHQAALTDLENGLAQSPKQWQHWFWVCVAGMVIFIPTIWLNRGRWSPKRAREDEDEHEEDVARELKELVGANA